MYNILFWNDLNSTFPIHIGYWSVLVGRSEPEPKVLAYQDSAKPLLEVIHHLKRENKFLKYEYKKQKGELEKLKEKENPVSGRDCNYEKTHDVSAESGLNNQILSTNNHIIQLRKFDSSSDTQTFCSSIYQQYNSLKENFVKIAVNIKKLLEITQNDLNECIDIKKQQWSVIKEQRLLVSTLNETKRNLIQEKTSLEFGFKEMETSLTVENEKISKSLEIKLTNKIEELNNCVETKVKDTSHIRAKEDELFKCIKDLKNHREEKYDLVNYIIKLNNKQKDKLVLMVAGNKTPKCREDEARREMDDLQEKLDFEKKDSESAKKKLKKEKDRVIDLKRSFAKMEEMKNNCEVQFNFMKEANSGELRECEKVKRLLKSKETTAKNLYDHCNEQYKQVISECRTKMVCTIPKLNTDTGKENDLIELVKAVNSYSEALNKLNDIEKNTNDSENNQNIVEKEKQLLENIDNIVKQFEVSNQKLEKTNESLTCLSQLKTCEYNKYELVRQFKIELEQSEIKMKSLKKSVDECMNKGKTLETCKSQLSEAESKVQKCKSVLLPYHTNVEIAKSQCSVSESKFRELNFLHEDCSRKLRKMITDSRELW